MFKSQPQSNSFQGGAGYRRGSERECWFCGKKGHIQKDCFKTKDQGHWRNERKPDRSLFSVAGNGTTKADLAVVQSLTASTATRIVQWPEFFHSQIIQPSIELQLKRPWVIDSGASYSLTPDKALFTMLHPLEEDITVTVGNGDTIKAVGKGSISFVFSFGLEMSIEARYVPGIHRSLLSVR